MRKETKRLGRGLDSLIKRTLVLEDEEEESGHGVDTELVRSLRNEGETPAEQVEPVLDSDAAGELVKVESVAQGVRSSKKTDSSAAFGPERLNDRGKPSAKSQDSLRAAHTGKTSDVRVAVNSENIASAPDLDGELVGTPSTYCVAALDSIVPHADQPRDLFNAGSIAQLAASIARQGVVQPLVVRRVAGDGALGGDDGVQFEIVAGERRWRAARAAGLREVPVIIQDVKDDEALEIALVENIQREDLNAIDRAKAYRKYCERFGVGADDLAQRLGEDRTTVVNYMRLLELPGLVKELVARGQLSMGHARCLLGVADEGSQVDLARAAVTNTLSVRALEDIVRRRKGDPQAPPARKPEQPSKARSANVADLESRLQETVGTRVLIKEGRRKGTGRFVVEFYSLDDFERIAKLLGLVAE